MYRLYISGLFSLLVAACGSLPSVPGTGTDSLTPGAAHAGQEASTLEAVAEDVDDLRLAPEVPTPPIKGGNRSRYDRALALLADDQWEAAEVVLLEITRSQPELAGPWLNVGYILQRRGDIQGAKGAFTSALEANPVSCDAHNELGILARRDGDFATAEKHYQACLKFNPYFAKAKLNLGILYELYMGRFGEALAAYQDYQLMLGEPNPQVDGWMADLERRVAALAKR